MSDFNVKAKTLHQAPTTTPSTSKVEPQHPVDSTAPVQEKSRQPQPTTGITTQKQLEDSDQVLASLSKAQQSVSPTQVSEGSSLLTEQLSKPPEPPKGPVTSRKSYVPGEKSELGKQMDLLRQKSRTGEGTYQTQLRQEHAKLSQEFERISLGAIGSSKAMRNAEKQLSAIDQRMSEIEKQIEDYKPHTRADMLHRFERGEGNIFRKLYEQAVSKSGGGEHDSLWQKVKGTLIESEDHQSSFHMGALTDLRKQYVNNLVQEVLNDLVQSLPPGQEKNDLQAQLLKANAFGSSNLTSDYDVIMGALSKQVVHLESRVVEEFNARFGKAFGVEGGEFFDTNVYTRGLAPNSSEELGTKTDGIRVGGSGPYKWTNPTAHAEHDRQQDIMSLVKQRKFMDQGEWNSYVDTLADKLPTDKQADLRDRYQQADGIFKGAETELKNKMEELRKLPQNKDLREDALELAASNRLYEDKLKDVNQVSRNSTGLDEDTLKSKLSFAMSKALLFANEPYFSEGTLRHVVGNEQELAREPVKLHISPGQAMQSFNENLGDTIKELKHLAKNPIGEVAFHSSKYIGRFCRALDVTLESLGQGHPMPKELTQAIALQQALLSVTPELQQLRGGNTSSVPSGTSTSDHARNILHEALKSLVPDTIAKLPESAADLQQLLLSVAQDVNSFVRPKLG